MGKLVRGIGDKGKDYSARKNSILLQEYKIWANVLTRCVPKFWVRHPSYKGASCSDNFRSYSYFYEWCQSQIGFKSKDEANRSWHLDKDLLVKGNKFYSEYTCVFIPHRLNMLLTKRDLGRGKCPVGVCKQKNIDKFMASCNDGNSQKYLGSYNTMNEAFLAYKTFKEALIKQVANEYKDQLDPRAYEALLNYQVEVTD